MLQLVLQAIVAASYAFAFVYHINDITSIPVPFVGLVWVVSLRFIPPLVPASALSWVTYLILVYQLLTFHDLNACLLEECKTDMLYEYIMLIGTAVLWLSMKDGIKKKKSEVKQPKPVEPKFKVQVVEPTPSVQPVRLKIGESLQPKWV